MLILRVFWAEFRKSLILFMRYPFGSLITVSVMLLLFIGIFETALRVSSVEELSSDQTRLAAQKFVLWTVMILGFSSVFAGLSQTGPAGCQFRVLPDHRSGFCSCIENGAVCECRAVPANMTRVGGDEADRAGRCVPLYHLAKDFTQACASAFVAKPLVGQWAIFASGIGQERIVIADARAAVAVIPSFSMVTFIVAPFIAVGMQHQRARDTTFGQHGLPDQGSCQVCALTLMHLPSDDFAAEDVHNGRGEEHARDRPGHPCYVPSPNLTGSAGLIAGGWFAPHRRLGTASVMLRPSARRIRNFPRPDIALDRPG